MPQIYILSVYKNKKKIRSTIPFVYRTLYYLCWCQFRKCPYVTIYHVNTYNANIANVLTYLIWSVVKYIKKTTSKSTKHKSGNLSEFLLRSYVRPTWIIVVIIIRIRHKNLNLHRSDRFNWNRSHNLSAIFFIQMCSIFRLTFWKIPKNLKKKICPWFPPP